MSKVDAYILLKVIVIVILWRWRKR